MINGSYWSQRPAAVVVAAWYVHGASKTNFKNSAPAGVNTYSGIALGPMWSHVDPGKTP